VGGRDVPTTRRVWPRGTVRFTSRDAYHDSFRLEYVGLAWVDEARPVIVHPIQSVAPASIPQTALGRPATPITHVKGRWTAGAGYS
jgi:hypothetical protein